MANNRPPYGEAFLAEAFRLATEPGYPIHGVARDLGVSHEDLRRHVAQARVDAGEREGLTVSDATPCRRQEA